MRGPRRCAPASSSPCSPSTWWWWGRRSPCSCATRARGERTVRRLARGSRLAALTLASCACTWTRPFTDGAGRVVPGSIAAMETVTLGGVEQSVWLRGRDVRAPVIILLHGGPGASESALFRRYDAALEEHFVVVYWEQRGAGRSYHADVPRSSMTIARMVEDLDRAEQRRVGEE